MSGWTSWCAALVVAACLLEPALPVHIQHARHASASESRLHDQRGWPSEPYVTHLHAPVHVRISQALEALPHRERTLFLAHHDVRDPGLDVHVARHLEKLVIHPSNLAESGYPSVRKLGRHTFTQTVLLASSTPDRDVGSGVLGTEGDLPSDVFPQEHPCASGSTHHVRAQSHIDCDTSDTRADSTAVERLSPREPTGSIHRAQCDDFHDSERGRTTRKPHIWMFWQNVGTAEQPGYIELCLRSVLKHNEDSFQVHILNKTTVSQFLSDLPPDLDELLPGLAQYTDYIRLKLLKKYGGIWLDSDLIVLSNLRPVFENLCRTGDGDFAGFGCTLGLHQPHRPCRDNYRHPSNWAMASIAGGKLVSWCAKEADRMLDTMRSGESRRDDGDSVHSKHYASFGRDLIAKYLQKHPSFEYYHVPSKCMDRDAKGFVISSASYVQQVLLLL